MSRRIHRVLAMLADSLGKLSPRSSARNAQAFASAGEPGAEAHETIALMELAIESPRAVSPSPSLELHLKKILVPVDFSPLSKKALQYAQRLAQQFKAELVLCHVLEPEIPPSFEGIMIAQTYSSGGLSSQLKQLKALASAARNAGAVRAGSMLRRGLPAYEIIEAAKDLDVDLIVIATHGYTGWKHFCIGSTAERVVRAAPCPVLVVREKEHEFI